MTKKVKLDLFVCLACNKVGGLKLCTIFEMAECSYNVIKHSMLAMWSRSSWASYSLPTVIAFAFSRHILFVQFTIIHLFTYVLFSICWIHFGYNVHIIHFMALDIGIESHQTTNKMKLISHTHHTHTHKNCMEKFI